MVTAGAGSEFGSCHEVRPPTSEIESASLVVELLNFGSWKDLGHNPSLYWTRKPRLPRPVPSRPSTCVRTDALWMRM